MGGNRTERGLGSVGGGKVTDAYCIHNVLRENSLWFDVWTSYLDRSWLELVPYLKVRWHSLELSSLSCVIFLQSEYNYHSHFTNVIFLSIVIGRLQRGKGAGVDVFDCGQVRASSVV